MNYFAIISLDLDRTKCNLQVAVLNNKSPILELKISWHPFRKQRKLPCFVAGFQ